MCLLLLVNLELNLLFLDPRLLVLRLQLNNQLILLQLAPCEIFLQLNKCTLNAIPCDFLFFKASHDLVGLSLVLSPLGFQLLFELLDTLFGARVRDDLGIILGFEILRILPLFVKDVEGDVARVSIHISQMVDEASGLTSVALQNRFENAGHFFASFITRKFNLLNDGVFLYCFENGCCTLPANIIPFKVDLLKTLI